MNVTFFKKSVGSLQIVALLAIGFAGFIPAKTNAATPTDTNLEYFKAHKYTIPLDGSDIPDIGATHDPFAAEGGTDVSTGGLNIASAFKALQKDPNAKVLDYPDGPDVPNPVYLRLKDEQRSVNQYYLKLVTDYQNYTALLASHIKNPNDQDAFTDKASSTTAGKTTVLKFEVAPSFLDSLRATYTTPDGSFSWLTMTADVVTGNKASLGAALYNSQIQPQIANNTSPATYYNRMQDERKQIDTAIVHIYVLTSILHSKKPAKNEFYRNGIDDLSSTDTLEAGEKLSDGRVASIYSKQSKAGAAKKFSTLHEFLAEYGPYDQEGSIAKPIDAIGQVSSEAQQSNGESLKGYGRCGTSSGGLFNLPSFNYDFCVLVDAASNLNNTLLFAGGYLLQVTAGIPGSADGNHTVKIKPEDSGQALVQNFWDGLLPPVVTTPFQNIMIDQSSSIGKTVASTSKVISNLMNIMMVLLFVASAVASILQIQVNTFGFRKLIPNLIIYFIIAQFSFFFLRAGLEVVGQVSNGIIGFADTDPNTDKANVFQNYVDTIAHVRGENGGRCFTSAPGGVPASPIASSCTGEINNAIVTQQLILNLFMFAGAILLLFLGGMFIFRVIIFTIAIPLAPLAILCRAVPPLGFIWARWWKTVSGWIIMPIPVVGMLLLSSVYFKAANITPGGSGLLASLFNYAVGIAFLVAATKLPGSFAGEAKMFLDRYNALGKSAYNKSITATKKAGSDEFQRQVGLSPVGQFLRDQKAKKAVKNEELDLNKKGQKTDVQRLMNDKRVEGINSQLAMATPEATTRRNDTKANIATQRTGLETKMREQQDILANLSSTPDQLDAARSELNKLDGRHAKLGKQIDSIDAEQSRVNGLDQNKLKAEVAKLKQPTRAGRRNIRTYQSEAVHHKEGEVRKQSLEQDKGEAERLLAAAPAHTTYNEASELLQISQGRTLEAKEEARESIRNNFLQASSAPEGFEREALKRRRVLTTYQGKLRGKRNDSAEADAERSARHEVIFSKKFDDVSAVPTGASDAEKNAAKNAEDNIKVAQREFNSEFTKAVNERNGNMYPNLEAEMKAVLNPTSNLPSGSLDELDDRRKAAINLRVTDNKMNTQTGTSIQDVKDAAAELLKSVDPADTVSKAALEAFATLDPTDEQVRKTMIADYRNCDFYRKGLVPLFSTPHIVISSDGKV